MTSSQAQQIKVQNLQLHVRVFGKGTPLLLGHGLICSGSMFDAIAHKLKDRFKLVIPDFRGHGQSESALSAWTLDDLVEDYKAITDVLQLNSVIHVGFSMGGMVSLRYALKYPQNVKALILIGTSADAEDTFRKLKFSLLGFLGKHF